MARAAPGRDRSRGCRSTSRHGAEPSAAAWVAAPGQRRSWSVSQPVEALRRRDRREHAAGRVVGEAERVEDRLDARVVAVGVVVRGALAEVAQPADELRRVRADELEHRLELARAPRAPLRNAGVATRCSAGSLRVASTRSLFGAVAADERAQVADRRPRVGHERAQLAQERRQVLGRRLGLGDQHVEVVERRAQVDERRVGAPQRGRQQRRARAPARRSRRRSPRAVALVLPTRPARSSRRSASAVTSREESTRKRVSAALVLGELADQRGARSTAAG